MSWIGLCLRTGTISASFQDKGNRPSRKEVFMISVMGGAKSSSSSSRLEVNGNEKSLNSTEVDVT